MPRFKKAVQIFIASLSLLAVKVSFAQSLFDKQAFNCDPAVPPTATNSSGVHGCGYPHIIILINNIIDWLVIIGFPLGALLVAYGGFVILTSAGSTQKRDQGKKIITGTIVALVVVALAYFIIQGVFTILGVTKDGIGGQLRTQSGINEDTTRLPTDP